MDGGNYWLPSVYVCIRFALQLTYPAAATLPSFTGLWVRTPRAETLSLVLKLNIFLLAKWAEVPITMMVELTCPVNALTVEQLLETTDLARLAERTPTSLTVLLSELMTPIFTASVRHLAL